MFEFLPPDCRQTREQRCCGEVMYSFVCNPATNSNDVGRYRRDQIASRPDGWHGSGTAEP